jgi:hypothetical protein
MLCLTYFVSLCDTSFRFVSFLHFPFRFVSSFFVSFRCISFRFVFVSQFSSTLRHICASRCECGTSISDYKYLSRSDVLIFKKFNKTNFIVHGINLHCIYNVEIVCCCMKVVELAEVL